MRRIRYRRFRTLAAATPLELPAGTDDARHRHAAICRHSSAQRRHASARRLQCTRRSAHSTQASIRLRNFSWAITLSVRSIVPRIRAGSARSIAAPPRTNPPGPSLRTDLALSASKFRSKPRSFARVGPARAVPDGDDDGGSPASSSLSGRVSSDGRRGTGGVVIDGLDQVIVESGPRIVPWPPRPGPIGVGIPSAVWHPHAARRRSALRNLP